MRRAERPNVVSRYSWGCTNSGLTPHQQCDVIEVWAMVRASGLHTQTGGVYLPGSDLEQVATNAQDPALPASDLD